MDQINFMSNTIMRKFIIGLSIFFFALSGIITFMASGNPAKNTRYQIILQGLEKDGLQLESEGFPVPLDKESSEHLTLSAIGYGSIRPIAANETSEDRAKNRSVEVKLVPIDKEI